MYYEEIVRIRQGNHVHDSMKACERFLQEVQCNPVEMSLKDGMHSACKFIAYNTNRAFSIGLLVVLVLPLPLLTIEYKSIK